METFSSMELYLMNGGNKQFIGRDGFWDVYHATPEEEATWDKEIIQKALCQLSHEVNMPLCKYAIDTLVFHGYKGLEQLLHQYLADAIPSRQIALATGLWIHYRYVDSFRIIHQILQSNRKERINDVFMALMEFKHNDDARRFMIACLEGNDPELAMKAHTCISCWAYTGIPQLRENNMIENLMPGNAAPANYSAALENLKRLFFPFQ
ncbi:MAG TPA: hypothetical protein PLC48_01350 [Ferruginibacter sp.]|mgnify:CR=1 FL=1|jgi:hypothetical protein|nr:hypothetical protein [Ferruginibacter sp.]